jgi:hypothetical protein
MGNCKHGLGQGECTTCEEQRVFKNMFFEPQLFSKINNNEQYGLVLSDPDMYGMINVMWLKAKNHFERINKEYTVTYYVKQLPISEQDRLKQDFRSIAMKEGFLFVPPRPLTQREQIMDEPNCFGCKTRLSYARGSMGCTECVQYACLCGLCFCDFPGGIIHTGQYVPKQPGLPRKLAARREYVKIVKAFSSREKALVALA